MSDGVSERRVGSENEVESRLRTRVDTFFHFPKKGNFVKKCIYAIYSEKRPWSEGASESKVGSKHGSGEWT